MNILITGIHGFVGSNLVSSLKGRHTLYGLDIVTPVKDGVVKTFSWKDIEPTSFPLYHLPQFDAIIHLAGKAHDTKNESVAQAYFDINTGLTRKIFDFFLESSSKKFIFFSSVKAAADSVVGDILTEDVVPAPVGPYGESKIKAEEYILKGEGKIEKGAGEVCGAVGQSGRLGLDRQVYILRPCMIHGPGNKGNLNLLYNVVKKGIPWPLGSFENRRSFTSIDNLCYVIEGLLTKAVPGGICVLKSDDDYDSYFEDTMRAGHYENRKESVDIMIRSSQSIIKQLVEYGVDFKRENGEFCYTREGGHSDSRILFHEDITGEEITSTLLARTRERENITILEHTTMYDFLMADNICYGVMAQMADGSKEKITADYTMLACGGLGGIYKHSTNYRHITGDALAIAKNHGIRLEHIDYIQIHPTTLYSEKPGRRFLISESVRGEGAILLNKEGNRFVNELLPRDLLTKEVHKQMAIDDMPYVRLSMAPIPKETIISHFPNIYKRCLEEGYDCTKEPIPVVPAQHYFMGGIWVDKDSHTSAGHLYAIGETSCNGVHGKNRLASNSLLESLVFARRAATHAMEEYTALPEKTFDDILQNDTLTNLTESYHKELLEAIEKEKEKTNHE